MGLSWLGSAVSWLGRVLVSFKWVPSSALAMRVRVCVCLGSGLAAVVRFTVGESHLEVAVLDSLDPPWVLALAPRRFLELEVHPPTDLVPAAGAGARKVRRL